MVEDTKLDTVVVPKSFLASLGMCPECFSVPKHHIDEPFSACNCGTGEDTAIRPLQKLQVLEAKHKASELDNGSKKESAS